MVGLRHACKIYQKDESPTYCHNATRPDTDNQPLSTWWLGRGFKIRPPISPYLKPTGFLLQFAKGYPSVSPLPILQELEIQMTETCAKIDQDISQHVEWIWKLVWYCSNHARNYISLTVCQLILLLLSISWLQTHWLNRQRHLLTSSAIGSDLQYSIRCISHTALFRLVR